jgi:uncharacterized membrane protein YfcA
MTLPLRAASDGENGPMITGVLIAAALALGYAVAVGLSMAATFGITAMSPAFVTREYRIRPAYKLVQELVWLACATAGGFVAAAVSGATMAWFAGAVLAGIMILVLWTNTWEMRQHGAMHQTMMSLASAAGVAAGYLLWMR